MKLIQIIFKKKMADIAQLDTQNNSGFDKSRQKAPSLFFIGT